MTAPRDPVGAAYDEAAEHWRVGSVPVYARLAAALLDRTPVALAGARVLDVGAGTAVAGRVALDRGAGTVVALDLAPGMLAGRDARIGAVVGDAGRLPFDDGSFDLATAAFCLSHVPDPVAVLAEARRVAGAVLASAFAPGVDHPAKEAADAVVAGHGFTAPGWYVRMKAVAQVDDPDRLAGIARAAGFGHVEVVRVDVDAGLEDAEAVADWRLSMAHLAPFVAGLDPEARDRARAEVVAAVTGMPRVVVAMLALSAT
ncbi:class I SAM-dependent methyltransferase [Marmoricola sp. RAF53]|uniref:class I SAM-dependent methyltransferase n=1 Tax=Marmoricola sp. RAF53 TaxID=3233059 RepID=UPI003F99F3CF